MAVERVEGVREAKFSYERAEGFVTFDTTMTSPDVFLAELDRMTGFSGTVRADGDSESMSHHTPEGSEEHREDDEHEHGHETGNEATSS